MKPVLTETMAKKIFSVMPDTQISRAYACMQEKRIRHLLVVDKDEHVVGVLSDRDVKKAIHCRVEKTENLKIISEKFDPSSQVQDFMSWDIFTIDSKSSVREVALHMLDKKISCLVVKDENNQVEGVVTTDDLLWILVKMLGEDDATLFDTIRNKLMSSSLGSFANTLSQAGI
jgi:acetoin utilization protein AcuB